MFFLEGENMDKIPDTEKVIFLRRKGLSQEMVDEAFKRFKEKKSKASQSENKDSSK